jgi:hypothetical protein
MWRTSRRLLSIMLLFALTSGLARAQDDTAVPPPSAPAAAASSSDPSVSPSNSASSQPTNIDPTGLTTGLETVIGPIPNLSCAVSAPGGVITVLQCVETQDH